MNIVEAYIKSNGQLVILISGISGCGKTALAKNISEDFKIKYIDQHNYYKDGWNTTIKLPDGNEIINYDTDEAVDWEKFIEDIKKNRSSGVVVSGFSLPSGRFDFKKDVHIHLNISKQQCLDKRKTFYDDNQQIFPNNYNFADDTAEKYKFNQYTFPYYLESTKAANITKFYTITDRTDDQTYDDIFDYLIEFIKKSVYKTEREPQRIKDGSKKGVSVGRPDGKYTIHGSMLERPKIVYDDELDMITALDSPQSRSSTTDDSDFDPDMSTESDSENDYRIKDGQIGFLNFK